MKSTIFKSLIFSSLLVVAVGCGKDGGGGGGSSSNNLGTPGNNISGTNKANYDLIAKWYNAAEIKSLRPYSKVSRQLSTSSNSTSSCPGEIKEYLGFIKVCVYSGSSTNTGVDGSMITYNVGLAQGTTANYDKPIYCDVSNCVTQTYPGKSSNAKLKAALKNTGLYLYSVTRLSNTVYQLTYTSSSLDASPKMLYKIDTSLHSMYNPVEVVDLNSLNQEYIILR